MNLENMGVVFWIALVCSCHLLLRTASTLQYDLPSSGSCRPFPDKIWMGCVPKANAEAGKYVNVGTVPLNSCIEECCEDSNCNVIFMYNSTCFKIECESDDACEPVPKEEEKFAHLARMVVVRPVKRSFQWEDQPDVNNDGDDLAMAANEGVSETACDDSVGSGCGLNEACIGNVCVCEEGFERDLNRKCARGTASSNLNSASKAATFSSAKMEQDSSTDSPLKKIIVTVVPKIIRLPDNEVTLSAFTVPAETQGSKNRYSYKWKLLSPKEGGETISETQGATLKLSHLTEGLYTFKVTVSATGEFGETEANVTVLPQKRENEPPIASILPAHQVVKLPNSLAVLDASSSRDDSEIVKYHWELQQGPLGYQPNLSDIQTLQLKDLHQPGNYTFRLTVTDSDGSTNSTLANITVLQVPDYPPEANAGSSIVLFLPKNNVTLNGSLSSDDKGIVSWEWTKSISDQDKAVDMQNTHTPFLQLSHLEEGMYTFVLKVTDNSGQSSSSDVHVFVKPPTNKPPVANAGSNVSIALPQTWVVLNGSFSADDIGIEHWKWEQLSGPQKSTFNPWNASVTNVTGLTKGEYVFQLTVVDGNENTASAIVGVTVTQNKNIPPKANAGGDKTLSLPLGVLILNGSQSYDDLRISKWQWTREPMSLAMGTMLDQSNTSPVLMVTNVVAGRYEFRLRVTDDQGEWDEDTVSIIIKPDPELLNLVELTLNIEAGRLTQSQRDSVLLKLGLLLRDASQLVVRNLKSDMNGRAMLVFYVTGPGGSVFGPQVVRTLKDKLAQDSFLLQLSVVDIRTSVCQNNCSGHGVCDQETRVCFCEAFWMQDLFIKYMGDGESNCGWSILYVGIALLSLAFVIVSGIWGLVCLCSRLCHGGSSSPKDNTRYALLESTEQVRLPIGKVTMSDSETDSDVLFENRHGKSNGIKNARNGYKPEKRIKT